MPVNARAIAVGSTLLLAAAASHAFNLGPLRGAAQVGQPLDVSVPVTLADGDQVANLCADADVNYENTRIDRTLVSIAPPSAGRAVVHIQSSVPVNEPVVTVNLRIGCAGPVARRYVLLADAPAVPTVVASPAGVSQASQSSMPIASGDAAAAIAASDSGAAIRSGAPTAIVPASADEIPPAERARREAAAFAAVAAAEQAAANPSAGPSPTQGPASAEPARRAPRPARGAAGPVRESAAPQRPHRAATAHRAPVRPAAVHVKPARPETKAESQLAKQEARGRVTSGPRLELDPVESLAETAPKLKVSPDLHGAAPASGAEGAAALGSAVPAAPAAAASDAVRLQALEADVAALRAENQKNQARLLQLNAQLQRAADRRDKLVDLLLALLAAAVLAAALLAWLLLRRPRPGRAAGSRRRPDEENALGPLGATIISPLHETPAHHEPPLAGAAPAWAADAWDGSVPTGTTQDPGAHRTAPHAAPVVPPAAPRPPLAPVEDAASRAVNAEELLDIQQQADFFVSLGQHEQAIELLRQHIDDNAGTSPLAYLDLLSIYHRFELHDDYDRLRAEFTRIFNVQVPPFEEFSAVAGAGLEAYPSELARIEAQWDSPAVVELIESFIFRRPDAAAASSELEPFAPEAYRELLLLFAIAKELAGEPGVHAHRVRRATAELTTDSVPAATIPPASPRLGIDIDLDGPSRRRADG